MGGTGDDDDGDQEDLSTADAYDPQSDSWHPLANMATRRANLAAAAAGGKIYAIGGSGTAGELAIHQSNAGELATVEAFDPQLGTWAEVASMSVGRCLHAVAVVDGKIYVIGGLGSFGLPIGQSEVYDPQANSWQLSAIMPHPRYMHAAAVMDGKIYVSGGRAPDGTDWTSTFTVFDPQANTWTELASMGTARAGHISAAIGGKLYVFGGETVDGHTSSDTCAQVLERGS